MKNILFLLPVLLSLSAHANNKTINFIASATLNTTCTISAESANFGVFDGLKPSSYSNGASHMATNMVNVFCNNKTPFTIKGMPYINKLGAVGRYMQGSSSTDEIVYTVYTRTDLNAGSWFADGATYPAGRSYTYSSLGTGSSQKIPLYFYAYPSSIYPGRMVKADTYSDNYTLTLIY